MAYAYRRRPLLSPMVTYAYRRRPLLSPMGRFAICLIQSQQFYFPMSEIALGVGIWTNSGYWEVLLGASKKKTQKRYPVFPSWLWLLIYKKMILWIAAAILYPWEEKRDIASTLRIAEQKDKKSLDPWWPWDHLRLDSLSVYWTLCLTFTKRSTAIC